MTIERLNKPQLAKKVLDLIGSNFFSGDRLQRFIQSNLASLSSASQIDLDYLTGSENKNVEIWAFVDSNGVPLGGITLNYYLWDRLSKQLYFLPAENGQGEMAVSIESFGTIVSRMMSPTDILQVAVELGYFATAEAERRRGVGRRLFEAFIHQAEAIPARGCLAFTIVMGKYSKTLFGDTLMKHLLRNGPEVARHPVMLKPILTDLKQPEDIFTPNADATPTALLAEQFNFSALCYGRYLGQVWCKYV